MITLEQAKNLKVGNIIYSIFKKDADGSPSRLRVNSKPKVWKTRLDLVQFTVKHGLYDVFRVDETDLDDFTLNDRFIVLAERYIQQKDSILYDVIDKYCPGQMLDNIIYMSSFKKLVVRYLEEEMEMYFET